MEDTIAAISTALGVGAISIIRVSGKEAIEIVNKIWSGKDLSTVPSHTIHYGFIKDGEEKIDEVLVSIMKAPKTFTKEDVIEINSHGWIATTNRVLELLLTCGCRLAEPGEFTKRAFLNGRIDLIEAEGVMDLISAKTEKSRTLALSQMTGKVSSMIHDLRKRLVDIISNIEVNIDYPEYEDIEVVTIEKIKENISYSGFDGWTRIDSDIMVNQACHTARQNVRSYLQYGRPNEKDCFEFAAIPMKGRIYARYFSEWNTSIFYYIITVDNEILEECDEKILSHSKLEQVLSDS